MEHPGTLARPPPHPSENQRLLAEHLARGNSHLPPPTAPGKPADQGKWGVLQPAVDHYYITLFLVVIIVVAVILALYFTGKFSSSSSSSGGGGLVGGGQSSAGGGGGGGGGGGQASSAGNGGGGGSPPVSSSATSFANNQYGGYRQYGGTGTESGTDGQYGGYVASYPPSSISNFETCVSAQTGIVSGKTLGDGGTTNGIIAIDLNAYAFQSANGFSNNMQICSELCCATSGCTSAALSQAGESYPSYNFFGCTNLNSAGALYGSGYDQCCVLRNSQADAYTSNTDFAYSSVFYTTNTYTCVQGVGKVSPSTIYNPSSVTSSYAMSGLNQAQYDACINECITTVSGCGGISVGTTTYSEGNPYVGANSVECYGPYCCLMYGQSVALTSNASFWSVQILPNVVGATSCST
jgi:hypothetical protein